MNTRDARAALAHRAHACTTDPPLVVTSSIRTTLLPGLKLPSIFRSGGPSSRCAPRSR